MTQYDPNQDHRLDPRVRAFLGGFPIGGGAAPDVGSRDDLLREAESPEGRARAKALKDLLELSDNEEVAPSTGLRIDTYQATSMPDGNTINIQFIRPDSNVILPCVYYIHGGGMQTMSCFDGNYRSWGKIIAAKGVAVAMVDFGEQHRALLRSRSRSISSGTERLRVRFPLGARSISSARNRP